MTSAWNPRIPQPQDKLEERRRRLVESILFYSHSRQFSRIILLDSTIDRVTSAALASVAPIEVPAISTSPSGPFSGPSYLEALLYITAASSLFEETTSEAHFFKITGGYLVRNIESLVNLYHRHRMDALGFLHQNPLRLAPRYAMTSCMAMSSHNWRLFVRELSAQLDALRTQPSESVYCEFLQRIGCRRGVSSPYPRLVASFGTAGRTNEAATYRVRETIWRAYSRTGLYVLSHQLLSSHEA